MRDDASARATRAFAGLVDLASAELGGRAMLCTDDFFAGMDRMLVPGRAVFDADRFTEQGKWMDGWESRRRRTPGHDWCIVKLGVKGRIRAVDVDTDHFLGNHPPYASLDAVCVDGDPTPEHLRDEVVWTEIVESTTLDRGARNLLVPGRDGVWTHVRLHIHPAGGVARLRVYGDPEPDLEGLVDLAALANGARAVSCSDMFFAPMEQLLLPGRPENMGGGWETRRRQGTPGHDWIHVRLAAPGILERIELDTAFFKGNFPERSAVWGLYWPEAPVHALPGASWTPIVPPSRMSADAVHAFDVAAGPFTHLRLDVLPDGGVSRLRAWGRVTPIDPFHTGDPGLDALNALEEDALTEALGRCCGSRRWVEAMAARWPFESRAVLHGHAVEAWWRLGRADWLEAFAHHPRIGEDPEALRARFAHADLSANEQAGVVGADEVVLAALAEGNRAYTERFGHVFLVCATGKSAVQMLAMLRDRMDNPPERELEIAAGEQAKITALRLEALA